MMTYIVDWSIYYSRNAKLAFLNFQLTGTLSVRGGEQGNIIMSNEKPYDNNKIYGIQYLRGFAALLVVTWHTWWVIGPEWKAIIKHFFIGVDIFFVISGFIIYSITSEKFNVTLKSFIAKRFFRIYPAFAFIWLIVFTIRFNDASFYDSLRSLLLFHVDYTAIAPAFKYNIIGPAWTLTYEIYFYAIFISACCISRKYRGLISSVIIISFSVLLQLFYNGKFDFASNVSAHTGSNSMFFAPISVLSCTMMWEFIAGMFLAWLYQASASLRSNINPYYKIAASILLILYFMRALFSDENLLQGITGFLAPSFCLVFGVLLLSEMLSIELKPLSFIGNISYSIYLSHWALIYTVPVFVPHVWSMMPKPYNVITFVMITIIVSALMYRYIEKPSIRFCRNLLACSEDEVKKPINNSSSA